MRKLILFLGGVLLLSAAAGGAYYAAFTPKTPVEQLLHDAAELAEDLDRRIVVEPWDLAARIGPGWECAATESDRVTRCSSGDWSVSWMVEREEKKAPVEALISAAEHASRRAHEERDTPGADFFLTRHGLAGFDGYLATSQTTRRPHLDYTFTGWFLDPRRGWLRLVASCETSSGDDAVQSRLDALAVLLTTSAHGRAAGPAPSWLSVEQRQAQSRLDDAMKRLASDDGTPASWLAAASEATSKDRGLPERRPGLTELLKKRCDALAQRGDLEAIEAAVGIAQNLWLWHPSQAAPVMQRILASATAGARATPAPAWIRHRIELALNLAALHDQEPLATLGVELEATDPLLLLEQHPVAVQRLVNARARRSVQKLLAVWFGGPLANPPASANFWSLAEMTGSAAALESKAVGKHVLSMLSKRSAYGKVSATSNGMGISYDTPHGAMGYYPSSGGAPPLGSETSIRVCDLYADTLVRAHRNRHPELEFPLFGTLPARDRAIGRLKAWLSRQNPEN